MEMIIDKNGRRRQAQPGEILQDGERLLVTLSLMDHALPLLHDGMGGEAGHKPGYVFSRDNSSSLYSAQAEYEARLANAWRGPTVERVVDAGVHPQDAYEKWLANAWRP